MATTILEGAEFRKCLLNSAGLKPKVIIKKLKDSDPMLSAPRVSTCINSYRQRKELLKQKIFRLLKDKKRKLEITYDQFWSEFITVEIK